MSDLEALLRSVVSTVLFLVLYRPISWVVESQLEQWTQSAVCHRFDARRVTVSCARR